MLPSVQVQKKERASIANSVKVAYAISTNGNAGVIIRYNLNAMCRAQEFRLLEIAK